jgi:hypothetical protein
MNHYRADIDGLRAVIAPHLMLHIGSPPFLGTAAIIRAGPCGHNVPDNCASTRFGNSFPAESPDVIFHGFH